MQMGTCNIGPVQRVCTCMLSFGFAFGRAQSGRTDVRLNVATYQAEAVRAPGAAVVARYRRMRGW